MEENKKNVTPESMKRDEVIDMYIRRKGVLKDKFPQILEAPKSIKEEYFALSNLINNLQTSRVETWGPTISSDGISIDSFVAEKYEDALTRFTKFNQENASYISPEEEANFKFPEIDFEGLKEKAQEGYSTFFNEYSKLVQEPFPEATIARLNEINREVCKEIIENEKSKEKLSNDEEIDKKNETINLIEESKFAQIYGKAKGRVKNAFSKIKSFFKEKMQGKDNGDKNSNEQDLDAK